MWHRTAAAALVLVLVIALAAPAQVGNGVYSRAVPPDKAAMERLNLKIEWTADVSVDGLRDPLTQIQTLDDQPVLQTRTCVLIPGDGLNRRLHNGSSNSAMAGTPTRTRSRPTRSSCSSPT